MNSTHFKFLSYIFAFLFILPLSAQEKKRSIEWGKEVRNNNTNLDRIITQDATGFYAIKSKQGNQAVVDGPQKVFIEHYNKDMNLTKSKELDLKWKKKKRQFEDAIMIGGQLYLFTSFNNQAKKKNFLFAQKLDKTRLQAEKKLHYIAEIDTRNKYKEGSFNFHISRDSSKVLIYNQLPDKKNQPEQFALRVYNNQLTLLWEKDITLPYEDSQFDIEDYQVDNRGNVYLLGILYNGGSSLGRRGQSNYQYVILTYTQDGDETNKYPVNLTNKFITDLTFRPSDNGQLVCCGFYSEKGTSSVKGTYFFRIDPATQEVSNENLKEFDFDFRTEYVSDRKKERLEKAENSGKSKKEAELNQFALDKLILRNDGGALLIAEQFYIEEEREYDNYYGGYNRFGSGNQYRYNYIYHYNDIIVVNINPKGEIEWASRIPKRQVTENDGGWFSSYAMSIVRDKINFVYNDNAKNIDLNAKSRRNPYTFTGRRAVIVLSQVNPDGTVNSYPLLQNKGTSILTQPSGCKQISAREMAIYGESSRAYRFGKLVL